MPSPALLRTTTARQVFAALTLSGGAPMARRGRLPAYDIGVIAWAPTTWELTYAGDLGVRPSLADRNDAARAVGQLQGPVTDWPNAATRVR